MMNWIGIFLWCERAGSPMYSVRQKRERNHVGMGARNPVIRLGVDVDGEPRERGAMALSQRNEEGGVVGAPEQCSRDTPLGERDIAGATRDGERSRAIPVQRPGHATRELSGCTSAAFWAGVRSADANAPSGISYVLATKRSSKSAARKAVM